MKVKTDTLLITGASTLLVGLAATQGLVSYYAQQGFVYDIKQDVTASNLEALGLDAGSVIFALLALALAYLGRKALVERFLNVACATGSLTMNVLSAPTLGPKAVAVYALPALLYIAASDRLIAAIRLRALAGRESVDKTSPLKVLRTMSLWALRLPLAPWSTVTMLRRRVLDATSLEAPTVAADKHAEAVYMSREVAELNSLKTNTDRVRAAVRALGLFAKPPEIYEWLTARGQDVSMSSINSTLSKERAKVKQDTTSKDSQGLADAAITAEPKSASRVNGAIPPSAQRRVRA